jgi:hypothetical protein
MQQKLTAVSITLPVLPILLAAGASLCLGELRAAGKQDSGNSGSTTVAYDSGTSGRGEGCKLGTYAGTTPLSQVPYYVAGEEDLRGGMTCTFRINSKLPLFTFHFSGQAESDSFGDLDITQGSSSEVIQTIENTTDPGSIVPAKAQSVLTTVDANFDGYEDLQLLSQCGGTGNCSYEFYLYDPKTNQFVHNDFLSNLATPSFDPAKKQVTSSSNSSVNDWQNAIYQYAHDRRYTLIHRQVSAWDRKSRTVTVSTYELRNGQMALVNSKTTPE